MNCKTFVLLLTALLPGCATVQQAVCPRLPPAPVMGPLPERSSVERMQSFLSGKLPLPTDYSLTSKPAAVGLKP